MVTNEIRLSLKQAFTELQNAESELNRPHEDVVSLSVCFGARQSLISMLRLFLNVSNSVKNTDSSINDLFNQCVKLDDRFSKIDLSAIRCNEIDHEACEGKYCLEVNKVGECVAAAKQVKLLLLEKLMINESELN